MHVACCGMVFWVNLSQINCHVIHDQDSCHCNELTPFPHINTGSFEIALPQLHGQSSKSCDVEDPPVWGFKGVSWREWCRVAPLSFIHVFIQYFVFLACLLCARNLEYNSEQKIDRTPTTKKLSLVEKTLIK